MFIDNNFQARVYVTRNQYTEGFLPLFKTQLGRDYYISTFCEFGGFCQFSVTALNSRANVSLTIPDSVTEVVFCVGGTQFRSKRDTYVLLKANEALLVESLDDLTGTRISADNNVVVLAGARDMNVSGTMSHLIEQLLPIEQWGKNFIVRSIDINSYGDIIKITSSSQDTRITMSGFPYVALPDPGMTISRHLDYGAISIIGSTHPIQVVQVSGLTNSSTNATNTIHPIAPGMSVVPAIEHYHDKQTMSCKSLDKTSSTRIVSPSSIDHYTISGTVSYLNGTTIPYSSYHMSILKSTNGNSDLVRIESTDREEFGGIERCVGSGVIIPLGFELISVSLIKQSKHNIN